jgi:hypothetical protein
MKNKTDQEPDVIAGNRFSDQVAELERGDLNRDLTHELNQLVRKVRENGAKGTLTLKLEVKPCDRAAKQVEIEAHITSKAPKAPRRKTLAFTTPSGELQKDDPDQMEFQDKGFGND